MLGAAHEPSAQHSEPASLPQTAQVELWQRVLGAVQVSPVVGVEQQPWPGPPQVTVAPMQAPFRQAPPAVSPQDVPEATQRPATQQPLLLQRLPVQQMSPVRPHNCPSTVLSVPASTGAAPPLPTAASTAIPPLPERPPLAPPPVPVTEPPLPLVSPPLPPAPPVSPSSPPVPVLPRPPVPRPFLPLLPQPEVRPAVTRASKPTHHTTLVVALVVIGESLPVRARATSR